MYNLDEFTEAYIECALWSTNDNSDESGGNPLEDNYSIADIADSAMETIIEDCKEFQENNKALLKKAYKLYSNKQWNPEALAGHDFWLTRNGHGAGFWDRGIGKVGEQLTEASKTYGSCDMYAGDDNKIYVM